MGQSKKICIVEDEATIRSSLSLFIEAKSVHKVVGDFDSFESYMEADIISDILILDIGLPGLSGLEGLPKIKEKYPDIDVIMLTTYQEVDVIFQALCNGACSYISKRTPLPKIIEAIHIVANGGSYMSPSIARKITEQMQGTTKPKKVELTDKQNKIVALIIDGKKYHEISEICEITVNTVRFHIKKIYATLEINSKVELYKKFTEGEI